MKKATTSAGVVPAVIVDEAWQEVGASFDRFCRYGLWPEPKPLRKRS